jgi:hypothetical protein
MPRRPTRGASRANGASALPTPIQSTLTTPLSSAYPSTYASEVEWDPDDDLKLIPISTLSLHDGSATTKPAASTTKGKPKPAGPFRFMDLPSELRIKVYGLYFADTGRVIDLDPDNYKRIHKKLGILRTCRAIYAEASHYFYSTHTVRLFPTHPGRFFKTKKPLLARLTPRQRSCLTSLELRLGPGWNKPPRGWIVNQALGLADCTSVRSLTVFVECDPSDGVFNGFRRADGFYEGFSRNLLDDVLTGLQSHNNLERIIFDAWSSVKKSGAMMTGLLDAVHTRTQRITWGPERGWTDRDEESDEKVRGHSHVLVSGISPSPGLVAHGGMNVVVVA